MRDVVKLVSETDTIKCSQFIERSVFFQKLAYGKSVTLTFGLLSRKLPKTRHCGGLIRQLRVRSECDQTCLLNGTKTHATRQSQTTDSAACAAKWGVTLSAQKVRSSVRWSATGIIAQSL